MWLGCWAKVNFINRRKIFMKKLLAIEEKIKDEYLNKGLTFKQLSKNHNISEAKIKQYFEAIGLPIVDNIVKNHKSKSFWIWQKKNSNRK
jgi:hypothetical protein